MALKKSLQKYCFGQILSIILAGTGLINGWLFDKKNVNIPAFQAAFTYTLILIGSTLYLILERRKKQDLIGLMKKHFFILIGSVIFDVAANWLVVKAFSELKIAEVMVFSGLSTPSAIVMALIWSVPSHRPKYTRMQIVGVLMALSAIVFYFYVSQKNAMTGSVMGIGCAIMSAVAYAASNNFQERVAQIMRPVDFLFGLGVIGSLASWLIVLVSTEEINQLFKQLDASVIILIFSYALILSSFYFLIPVYMSKHSAVSFNFSLLTANFLGLMASWWLLNASYSNWLYFSIILINSGLLIYYIGEESEYYETRIQEEFKETLKV